MRLNELADNPGARKSRIRVGRGPADGKGKTAGRGVKGQKSRSGVAIKGFEGGQMPIHMRLPKRGFTNIHAKQYVEVTLERIQRAIDAGKLKAGKLTAESLCEAGVIRRVKEGLRVLATGEIKAKIDITAAGVTAGAKAAIEKAGGSVSILTRSIPPAGKKSLAKAESAKPPAGKKKTAKASPAKQPTTTKQTAAKQPAAKPDRDASNGPDSAKEE